MALDLCDEPFLVRCAGLEPALARDHRFHSHRGEARKSCRNRGKMAPTEWLTRCG
jgi:hypothetical protein